MLTTTIKTDQCPAGLTFRECGYVPGMYRLSPQKYTEQDKRVFICMHTNSESVRFCVHPGGSIGVWSDSGSEPRRFVRITAEITLKGT